MNEAYPLYWPEGRPRTDGRRRERSRFKTTFGQARNALMAALRLLGAREVVLSTNIPLRNDGLPYASTRPPEDPGVAVYFTYKKNKMCFACDRWDRVQDNAQAIRHTIEALRGVARWGTGDMMEAAFRGFVALPPPGVATPSWKTVLGLGASSEVGPCTAQALRARWKIVRSIHHPDKGGNADQFFEMKRAYEQGCAALGIEP
jgi:hypothetical protein